MADPVVLSYHDSLLRRSDVRLLQKNEWINDTLIGFVYEYFEHDKFVGNDAVLFAQPSMVQLLKLCQDDELACLLESWNVTDKQLVFLPINDEGSHYIAGGSHWSLLVFERRTSTFYHFDSVKEHNVGPARDLSQKLRFHFGGHLSGPCLRKVECPQQENCSDCGIFVINFTEQLCEKEVTTSLQDITLTTPPTNYRKTLQQLIKQHQNKK